MPLSKYERLTMSVADAESQRNEKLLAIAAQKPSLRQNIICGADAALWRERSNMRSADAEAYQHERKLMACTVRNMESDAKTLAKQLQWHETLRDTTQSLSRANLLRHQGLPSWIILEGMKIGEAVQDRQIPAVRTADAIRTRQAEGNKASAAGSVATSSTQSGHAQNAKEAVCESQ